MPWPCTPPVSTDISKTLADLPPPQGLMRTEDQRLGMLRVTKGSGA